MASARKAPSAGRDEEALRQWDKEAKSLRGKERTTAKSEAVDWWVEVMLWWEAVPAENVLVHPRLVWTDLYHTEYLPYIQSFGQAPPLISSRMSKAARNASGEAPGQPPGGWFRARDEALVAVSIQWTGHEPATGKPNAMLKLQSRPNHSKYAECDDCAALRKRYEAALKSRQGVAARHIVRADLINHVQDTFAERRVVAAERKAAHNSTDTVFEVDDKLGSWWQFLSMSQHERVEKGTTDNWCYKACLQGNFWPGVGNHVQWCRRCCARGQTLDARRLSLLSTT